MTFIEILEEINKMNVERLHSLKLYVDSHIALIDAKDKIDSINSQKDKFWQEDEECL
jgi:hypothetical protein